MFNIGLRLVGAGFLPRFDGVVSGFVLRKFRKVGNGVRKLGYCIDIVRRLCHR